MDSLMYCRRCKKIIGCKLNEKWKSCIGCQFLIQCEKRKNETWGLTQEPRKVIVYNIICKICEANDPSDSCG
jgi:hypothetical protein